MRVLLDECLPAELHRILIEMSHECQTVRQAGFGSKKNGELLTIAEGRWDILLTSDRNIKHQQNMAGRSVSIIILRARSNRMKDLLPLMSACREALLSQTSSTSSSYYRARYYDPGSGRFASEDPLGFKASENFYSYVSNSPVDWIDPTGLLAELICEPIASMRAGWKNATALKLGRAHHCFIHVKCKDYDVTIELTGPQEDSKHGKPQKEPFNRGRRGITRPITFPSGYKCCQNEDLMLDAFRRLSSNLPVYNGYPGPEQQHFRFPDY